MIIFIWLYYFQITRRSLGDVIIINYVIMVINIYLYFYVYSSVSLSCFYEFPISPLIGWSKETPLKYSLLYREFCSAKLDCFWMLYWFIQPSQKFIQSTVYAILLLYFSSVISMLFSQFTFYVLPKAKLSFLLIFLVEDSFLLSHKLDKKAQQIYVY